MHIESWDLATAESGEPARPGLMQRILAGLQAWTCTQELDPHLARDVGQSTYSVPVLAARWIGGSRA